jgi:hypothetical protein
MEANNQTRFGAHPNLYLIHNLFLAGKTAADVKFTTYPYLVSRLRMRGDVPLLPHTLSWR